MDVDIAIVGGGLVGLSLLAALVNTDYSVVLLERQSTEQLLHQDQDNRGIALSYDSIEILKTWHLWDILADYAYRIEKVHVSVAGSFGFMELNSNDYGLKYLGQLIPIRDLVANLLKNIQDSRINLQILSPSEISDINFNAINRKWTINDTSNVKVTAKLLIAADGTNSWIRKNQNIKIEQTLEQRTAIVTKLHTSLANFYVAYQRLTDLGTIACLPFGDKQVKTIITTTNNKAKLLLQQPTNIFMQQLQTAFGYRLGKFLQCDHRVSYPIMQLRAHQIVAQNLVFLGNSANTIYPITAQGFNLALRDVATLGALLTKYTANNLCQNIDAMLLQYSIQRKTDHNNTYNFTKKIAQACYVNNNFIKNSRNIILALLDFYRPINRYIVQHGVGRIVGY